MDDGNGVLISYFDPFESFDSVKGEFLHVLPLQNVHWKNANGTVRTVSQLPVNLVMENSLDSGSKGSLKQNPFIRILVVSCKSVDEYRSKARPLIRQWLPTDNAEDTQKSISTELSDMAKDLDKPLPVIFLFNNAEIVDSKLFKSVSLLDKLNKDFPEIKTLEVKSVYKSQKEREEFWVKLSQQLKSSLLDIFQKRLATYEKLLSSSKQFKEQLLLREKILVLFLSFGLEDEASSKLNFVRDLLQSEEIDSLKPGELTLPFEMFNNQDMNSIAELFNSDTITRFELMKYFFHCKFLLLRMKNEPNQRCIDLYPLVRTFIRKTSEIYKTSENLLEFQYQVIDNIMNEILIDKNIESTVSIEVKAELLLMQRDIWLRAIKILKGYEINGKHFPESEVEYSFNIKQDTYSNEAVYRKNYFDKTNQIITLFNKVGNARQRIVDILSLEIGTFYLQEKNYTKAVQIFVASSQYYTQSNWTIIGLSVLKKFIESIKSCKNVESLNFNGEEVPINTILSNVYLDVVHFVQDQNEKVKWWKLFLDSQLLSDVKFTHSAEGFFEVKISNSTYIKEANTYAIDVDIKNLAFDGDVQVDMITLVVRNSNDEFMSFTAPSATFTSNLTTLSLETTDVIFGEFFPVSIEIEIGNTLLSKEYINDGNIKPIFVRKLYDTSSFQISLTQSKNLTLNESSLAATVHNLDTVKEYWASIEVMTLNGIVPVSFSSSSEVSNCHFTNNTFQESIPYFTKGQIQQFTLKMITKFRKSTNDKLYSVSEIITQECYLPVSVSVEDIFKKDFFCFKFHLNSYMRQNPILLMSSKLSMPKNNTDYNIFGNYTPDIPVYLTDESSGSCLNCYQISSKKPFNPNDVFELNVEYVMFKDHLDCLVTDGLLVQGDVEWYAKFEPWKCMWTEEVLPKLLYDFYEFQMNGKILLYSNSIDVAELRCFFKNLSIDKHVCKRIVSCLEDICTGVELNDIDIDAYTQNLTPRKFVVPVNIPEFEPFFNIDIAQIGDNQLEVGEIVEFNVEIEALTKLWEGAEFEGVFTLEIGTSNDWLVHGKKRMKFFKERQQLNVMLLPLRKGYLTLPKITITDKHGEHARLNIPTAYKTYLVY